MSTSLREQLLKLQTPQSSQFFDTKSRDSILFTSGEAATKSRDTIYEIGISGLKELIEINYEFYKFESTLFDHTARDVQRAVETKEVNRLINDNIKSFMYHASPYFMIPATHKCLEWLIRRFNINRYNKEEFLILILPYHQTNMFVRCIQTMKFDSKDKWDFLADVKKSNTPLSKYALWTYGSSQPAFLEFVGKNTYNAIKELDPRADSLQTMIAFYVTTIVGALEHSSTINNNHILTISKYLVKTYKSNVTDFCAAGYMITAQLLIKTKLSTKLLQELMERITATLNPKLLRDMILLITLMFQSQTNELMITDETLDNLSKIKGFISFLNHIRKDGKAITNFLKALFHKILLRIQKQEDKYQDMCNELLSEILLEDEEAYIIIRLFLDSYLEEEKSSDEGKNLDGDTEIISLDSDDEMLPLKSQGITAWYSNCLKSLEIKYAMAFDLVVKDVMMKNTHYKRNGLKNVLGFLLNMPFEDNGAKMFENLYHRNSDIRSRAVVSLVKNLKKIERTPENIEILKMAITGRLNDENPKVVSEILKIGIEPLKEVVEADELIARLSKILMKCWKHAEKWSEVTPIALKTLTSNLSEGSDSNIIMFSLLPFLFPQDNDGIKYIEIIRISHFGKQSNMFGKLSKCSDFSNNSVAMDEYLQHSAKLPTSESLLATIHNSAEKERFSGYFSEAFACYLLSCSLKSNVDAKLSLEIFRTLKNVMNSSKINLNHTEIISCDSFKNNGVPLNVIERIFQKIIESTKFGSYEIDFLNQNDEMSLTLTMFESILDLFFQIDMNQRVKINEILKLLLDKVCQNDFVSKLTFFSQFCTLHTIYFDKATFNFEFQVRVLRLFNHLLKTSKENLKLCAPEMHQNIILSLGSQTTKIRELGMNIVETLKNQNIELCWKFLYEKIWERRYEILMENEQIKMLIYVFSNDKKSKHISSVVDSFIMRIKSKSTFENIQSEIFETLKHLTDKKLLDLLAQIASELIDKSNKANYHHFNEYQSVVIKLALNKVNRSTISGLWNLTMKSLKCHRILINDESGKILTPSILALKAVDDELFSKLHPDHKRELFVSVLECSMNDQSNVVYTARKVLQSIAFDYKIVRSILMKLCSILKQKNESSNNLLTSTEWKMGITLLELLQNKTKGTDGQLELINVLFDVLDNCINFTSTFDIEYVIQNVLSLLLVLCKKITSREIYDHSSTIKSELIIKCIKESQNPQTHHHSLLLLSEMALLVPEQILRDIMTIFTFVGTALMRHDDSYSFQIITKIIENIIPKFVKDGSENDVVPILKIFASIVLDVPEHRRIMLYTKLLNTLGSEKFTWQLIAALLEIKVVKHRKGPQQQVEMPVHLQIAISLIKEFDLKVILKSCTMLIIYMKTLPMTVDNLKSQTTHKSQNDMEKEIFCIETVTNVQLRHFKYLISVFVKHTLESPEVKHKTLQTPTEAMEEMKAQFQDLILNTLILIPDISKYLDQKSHEKSWSVILQTSFDILDASIALLEPDMLLIVVERLLCHEFLLVRKKVLELLNRKLEDNYFEKCEVYKLVKIVVPLRDIVTTIGKHTNLAEEVVQQLTLVGIKLLAKRLYEEYPELFAECLQDLTEILENNMNMKTPVMINLVLCVAELIGHLKVRSIPSLGKIMPILVKLLAVQENNSSSYLLLYAVASSMLKIIETVPLFLSPYLSSIILQLTRIVPILKLLKNSKMSPTTTGKISKIWLTIASSIPLRVLFPIFTEIFDKVIQKQEYSSIEPLMEFVYEIFQCADVKDIKNHQVELTEFFTKSLEYRCIANNELSFKEVNDTELHIIRASTALIMKLSEGSFRQLFESITLWALKNDTVNNNRLITYFRLTSEISVALKSLFLLFASDFLDNVGPTLNMCNNSKNDDLCFGENNEKNLYLAEYILRTLHNIFLYGQQNFMNTHRFDLIMQPIVDQMENIIAIRDEGIQQLIRMCISQLAVAASDDILWKQLNYQVLLKTRSDIPEVRIIGMKTCVDIARKLAEDYESLIPETIPFLSELLEDDNYEVVQSCQNIIRELETIVGESLQRYF